MSPKHLRTTPASRKAGRAVAVATTLAVAVTGLAAPALAGKPDRSTSTASCSATPDPVAHNSDYTLSVQGLAGGEIVNVQVSDSGGTTSWQLQADATGRLSVVGHAWWTGTSSVAVKKQVRRSWSVLATCSFAVV